MEGDMNKAIGAILAVVCTSAFADDSGFYIGADVGRSKTSASGVVTKSTDTVFGVMAGYQFDRNWALEAQYTGLGKYSGIGATSGSAYSNKTDAFSLAAVAALPLSDSFSLYAKLGVARAKNNQTSVASGSRSTSRTAATYGLGVQYAVTPALGVRFGWDRFGSNAITSANATLSRNINIWSLGAVYRF